MSMLAGYSSRYPRQGKFAILCEGDVAGYETDLLERWFALQPHLFVDVWACGTKTAIVGMADAIGRAIPFSAIEDRDYRTLEHAEKDCQAALQDRADRRALVRSWKAWNRHEIENYLIEPMVVAPVLAQWFGVSEADVLARLAEVLSQSAVDQAAQCTLSILRSSFPDPQRAVGGLPRVGGRPQWSKQSKAIVSPDRATVEQKLDDILQDAWKRFGEKHQRIDIAGIMATFKSLADNWSKVQLEDQTWRTDWAGKEILVSLCRWLAAEFGWPIGDGKTRELIEWSELSRVAAVQKDREIAWELQPDLTATFLTYLESTRDGEIRREWDEITKPAVALA